jgi:hypothetical protein
MIERKGAQERKRKFFTSGALKAVTDGFDPGF